MLRKIQVAAVLAFVLLLGNETATKAQDSATHAGVRWRPLQGSLPP